MRRWAGLLAAVACCGLIRHAAALSPSEVCVIYNTKSNDSLALANYYMKARQIPRGNLIPLVCAVGESTTEEEYRRNLVPQVQRALAAHPDAKCLVTTYDVPLKIAAWQPNMAERQEINTYKAQLGAVLQDLDKYVAKYDHVAAAGAQTQAAPATAPANVALNLQEEIKKLNTAANAAIGRMEKLGDTEKATAMREFASAQEHVAGMRGLLATFQVREGSPGADEAHVQIEKQQAQLREIDRQVQELVKDRHNPASRRKLVELSRTVRGLIGEAGEIQDVLTFIDPPETESCFDNELTMVLADQDYPRGHWLGNPKNIAVWSTTQRMAKIPQTILVTRIDGLTVAAAEDMIATGIAVEKVGLKGKIYLDARGLQTTDYAVFDRELRELAGWLKTHSTMDCVLDDKPELFLAKDCPDAALYCGWYSPHVYKDSCQWVKGGVGYHVASYEMMSLHDPREQGWVISLLKRGYCGTLGPTAEPYLASFPNPAHFFPLLMSGEFTQGEVWEVTAPMLSWRTGYAGDPLYNPFKNDPCVKVEALREDPVLRNAFAILRPQAASDKPEKPAVTQPAPATAPGLTPLPGAAASAPATAP